MRRPRTPCHPQHSPKQGFNAAMPHAGPRSDLYACLADGGAIVLDLGEERYYAMELPKCDTSPDIQLLELIGIRPTRTVVNMDDLMIALAEKPQLRHAVRHAWTLLMSVCTVVATRAMFGMPRVVNRIQRLKAKHSHRTMRTEAGNRLPWAVHSFRRFRPFL